MPTAKCTHQGCNAAFTKSSKSRAEQALRMHIGRSHDRNINPPNTMNGHTNGDGRALIIDAEADKKHPRSLLTNTEVTKIIEFINAHRNEFPTKLGCFREAVKSVGADKRLLITSGAAIRYFQKAEQSASATADTDPAPIKRKYTRRQAEPVAHEIHVNFCPNCGCNIHAVATGMAMAKIS